MEDNWAGGFRLIGGKPAKKPNTKPYGFPGYTVYNGYVSTLEKSPKLIGNTKFKTFSNLVANVPIVTASLFYFKNILGKSIWSIQATSSEPKAQEVAKKVQRLLYDTRTPFNSVAARAAMYYFFGFSVQEWTAERKKYGLIGFKDVAPRPQHTIERWHVDNSGEVKGITQRVDSVSAEVYLPRERLLYVVDNSIYDAPDGLGALRGVIESAEKLQSLQFLESLGYDSDLRGVPIARAPLAEMYTQKAAGELSDEDINQLLNPVLDWIQNPSRKYGQSILLDSDTYRDNEDTPSAQKKWDLQSMESYSKTQAEINKTIVREIAQVARVLGTEHLVLGDSERGSFALAKAKVDNFYVTVDTISREVAQAIQRDLVKPLLALNGWPQELCPKVCVDIAKQEDPEIIGTYIKNLAFAGLLPEDSALTARLLRIAGLSYNTDFEEYAEDSM